MKPLKMGPKTAVDRYLLLKITPEMGEQIVESWNSGNETYADRMLFHQQIVEMIQEAMSYREMDRAFRTN